MKKIKLWDTKKSLVIAIALLVVLGGCGVDDQNKMQGEQAVQAAEETIAAFYIDEKKAELVKDISEEKLAEARKKIDAVTDEKIANILTKDLEEVEILWNAQERVRGLLEDGILIEGADEKQIANLSKLVIEVREINNIFADALNKDVEEIKNQYESLKAAREKVYGLFSEEAQEAVNKEVTRDQFKEAKSSLEGVLNEKEKANLQVLLTLVDADLAVKEDAEKKRLAAEQKEKEEREEKERQLAEAKEQATEKPKTEEALKPDNQSGSAANEDKTKDKAPTKEEATPKSPSEPTYINGVLIASKKYPLPESHAPGESGQARSAFNEMAAAAKKEGFNLTAFSTYRSYTYQVGLFDRYAKQNGIKEANRYSARAGESEHQTGLAFDVGEVGKEGEWARQKFGDTEAGKWIAKNAHHSGFIVRYPQGKESVTGYIYEPWHLRYVGKELATKIYNSGSTLEEYLAA